jgi:acetoacetyl-CoA synthetase
MPSMLTLPLSDTGLSDTGRTEPHRTVIYEPSPQTIEGSQLTRFTRALQEACGREFADYEDLHDFSRTGFRLFWREFLRWSGLRTSGAVEPACLGDDIQAARFFPNLLLNYAENLLAPAEDDPGRTALTCLRADGGRSSLTRGELRDRVLALARSLEALGLRPGSRVAAVLRNDADAVVAALATAAIGATFSAVAPEMGADAMIDRFAPLRPDLLVAHLAARAHDAGIPVAERVARVAGALPSLRAVVSLGEPCEPSGIAVPVLPLSGMLEGAGEAVSEWRRFPFDHPLIILFTSGTTGRPKGIVHGAGGTLLKAMVEMRLHMDLSESDKFLFCASASWVIWSWQLQALAAGTEIVMYDGPLRDARTLWEIVAAERVTVFGTSPGYLKMSEDAGIVPGADYDLGALRLIVATGAILHDGQYFWVRDAVKHLPLQSLVGSTDIMGTFMLGNPNLPVYPGECSCRCLGHDVRAIVPPDGQGIGDVVLATPFPSRPLGLVDDPDGSRFHASYFAQHPGLWTQGDLIEFTGRGTARLHGRSDGVLNPRGIRVGPAEIYKVLEDFPTITEAMAVEQRHPAEFAEGRIVLFVVMRRGYDFDEALALRIRHRLRERASAAHVPAAIIPVAELPVTQSGKPSQAALTDAVNGRPARNAGALRNPDCLAVIAGHPALAPGVAPELAADGAAEGGDTGTVPWLRNLWEAVLRHSPIGPHDDFFDLGGNSLTAARLFAEIRRRTGRDLPIATLLRAPTPAALAEVIDRQSWSPTSRLAQLRPGQGRPLFLIHSMSGSLMELWAVVRAIGESRPIYGIQALGLEPGQEPQTSVEVMAEDYIALMRSVQPEGPYAVAGYSFGGMVAFEISQRLSQRGERIELTALIDTHIHTRFLPWRQRLQVTCMRPLNAVRAVVQAPPGQRLARFSGKMTRLGTRLRLRLGRAGPCPEAVGNLVSAAHFPEEIKRVRGALTLAAWAYRPQPFAGRLTYIRARGPELETLECEDPVPVWRRLARGGFEVHDVPGNHTNMIAEPNASALAAALDRCLRTCS